MTSLSTQPSIGPDNAIISAFNGLRETLRDTLNVVPTDVLGFNFNPGPRGARYYRCERKGRIELIHLWLEEYRWGLEIIYHPQFTLLRGYYNESYYCWMEIPGMMQTAFLDFCQEPELIQGGAFPPSTSTGRQTAEDIYSHLERHQLLRSIHCGREVLLQSLAEIIDQQHKD